MARAHKSGRNQGIELLRIVAAFGVVAFHAGVKPVGVYYGGLVVFLALSPMFEMGANFGRKRTLGELAATFVLPFLFWFPIYGLANLVKGKPLLVENDALGLLAGTSIHLWFLPFMFVVLLVLSQLKHRALRMPLFVLSIVATLALVATSPMWRNLPIVSHAPVGQWLHATVAVTVGIAIGLAQGSLRLMAVVLLTIAMSLPMMWLQDNPLFSPLAYTVGLVSLLAVLHVPQSWTSGIDVTPVSGCMMGVYLMHPLALTVFGAVLGKGTLPTAIAAFVSCAIATYLLRADLPLLRPVVRPVVETQARLERAFRGY